MSEVTLPPLELSQVLTPDLGSSPQTPVSEIADLKIEASPAVSTYKQRHDATRGTIIKEGDVRDGWDHLFSYLHRLMTSQLLNCTTGQEGRYDQLREISKRVCRDWINQADVGCSCDFYTFYYTGKPDENACSSLRERRGGTSAGRRSGIGCTGLGLSIPSSLRRYV
jgi:hypothetical protein